MTKQIVSAYDPGLPTAPRFIAPNLIACDSWTGKDASYVQDLQERTCSCPDFTYRKAGTGLLCKHLAALLTIEEQPAVPTVDEALARWEAAEKASQAAFAAVIGTLCPAEPKPPIGTSVKLWGPTSEQEAFA